MQFSVHAIQILLHMMHSTACIMHSTACMSQIKSQLCTLWASCRCLRPLRWRTPLAFYLHLQSSPMRTVAAAPSLQRLRGSSALAAAPSPQRTRPCTLSPLRPHRSGRAPVSSCGALTACNTSPQRLTGATKQAAALGITGLAAPRLRIIANLYIS